MKIYNIQTFEKLKIRPVDVNSLHDENPSAVEMVDARSIGFSDLKFGYIVETDETYLDINPFYMLVDVNIFVKMMDAFDPKLVLLQPDNKNHDDMTYLRLEAYRKDWPCYNGDSKFDIKHVYIINCDPSKVETKGDFIKIYNKYMQYIDRP